MLNCKPDSLPRTTGRAAADFSFKGITIAAGALTREDARNAWTQLFQRVRSRRGPPERRGR